MNAQPPLQLIHSDVVFHSGPGRMSLAFWQTRSTHEIVDSLQPGRREALRVKPDGRVMNGNTRVKVLTEKGFDVDSLPREMAP
jgi:hypothetical protein